MIQLFVLLDYLGEAKLYLCPIQNCQVDKYPDGGLSLNVITLDV